MEIDFKPDRKKIIAFALLIIIRLAVHRAYSDYGGFGCSSHICAGGEAETVVESAGCLFEPEKIAGNEKPGSIFWNNLEIIAMIIVGLVSLLYAVLLLPVVLNGLIFHTYFGLALYAVEVLYLYALAVLLVKCREKYGK